MKQNSWEWDEDDLLDLIRLGIQEGLELDYKQCDALQKSDGKKNEISKDVSSFANSAGGVIVYGMKENKHTPTSIDIGYNPVEISKEWLEQVINSRIHRRIDGVRVNQISLPKTSPGNVVYVVTIPASSRAPHQAADKRFYKRFNFESVAIEEYEIRDVSNRSTAPDLDIELRFGIGESQATLEENGDRYSDLELIAVISNTSTCVAEYAVIHLFIDSQIEVEASGPDVRVNPETDSIDLDGMQIALKKLTILWDRSKGLPLFFGISAHLPATPLTISIPKNNGLFALRYTIGSPGMSIRDKWVFLKIEDGTATFMRPNELSPENQV